MSINIMPNWETLLKHGLVIMLLVNILMPQAKAQNLILQDTVITDTAVFSATSSITAGPNFTIANTGNVTFATKNIFIRPNFVILSRGQFFALNAPISPIKPTKYPKLPNEFTVEQNYPNPFNPTTNIQYSIGSKQRVLLKVFDLLGKEILTLVHEEKPAGVYKVEFNASKLSSGIYFYQLQAGDFIETKKMILMR